MNILAFIERSEFFKGMSDKSRQLLADICIPKEIAKKETLFRERDKGHAFYLLASGNVGLYKGMPDGREVVIKVIQPGEPFAEVILFEQDRYPVTAVAMKPSLVFLIPKQQFCCLLAIEDFRNDFISMLMRKQRYLAERIKYLTMHDVEERFFLFVKEHYGEKQKVVPAISKKDIAATINTTPETYSRLIARLEQDGKIQVDGKAIHLKDNFWEEWEERLRSGD